VVIGGRNTPVFRPFCCIYNKIITMFTNSLSSFKNVCLMAVLTSIFCTALFFTQTAPASAQTGANLSELQAQIATLMARISALQAGGTSNSGTGFGGGGSSSIRSYTVADVTSVTKQFVDPSKAIADEEYTQYVITLKTGQKIEVKVPVRVVSSTVEELFRKSGFVGKASELMSWATSSSSLDETFKVGVSSFSASVSFTLNNGCAGYIISWGDGAKTERAGFPTGRACTMAIVNVAKDHTYAKAGTYNVKVERFDGQTLKDTSTKEIKVGPEASRAYTLADVTSITKQVVAGSRMLADGGHTLYTVTLKNGRKIEVKISSGPITASMVEAEFRKSGYTGYVTELLARATEVSNAPRITLVAGNDRLYSATVVLARPSQPRVVTGPTTLGTIDWGDGVTEGLVGLITSNQMTVKISHRYKTAGTFTVTVKGLDGESVSQKVVVGTYGTSDNYALSMYSPANNTSFKTGDRVILEWKTTNLTNEKASVILFGNNTERYMLRNIPLKTGTASFVIPTTDSLGPVVSGTYKIMIAVVGTKDGDPKNVTDTVSISITRPTTGGYGGSSATVPQSNSFGCNRSVATKLANGSVACYGMWDYGNDFGGDVNMCGDYTNPKKGCVIKTPVCQSGVANATAYMSAGSITTGQLATISTRLKVTPEVGKAGIAGLWEYTCIPTTVTTPPISTGWGSSSGSTTRSGVVRGASTDIMSEISLTLTNIANIITDLK
jgi:hypothetical protein